MQNKNALRWIIGDSNGIIKMTKCKNIDKSSIIVVECMSLRDGILAAKNGYSNLEIEEGLKNSYRLIQ